MIKKMQVAVLYGGKSTEHEVSVHSAQTVCSVLASSEKYEVLPIFIDKEGYWFLQKQCGEKTQNDIAVTPVISSQGKIFIPSTQTYLSPKVFFPVLHGSNGEDGTLQGLLECLDIAYVGCGVLASAMGMDKETSKWVSLQQGVATLPYQKISRDTSYNKKELEKWVAQIGYPVFVKPIRLGSSIGVTKVKKEEDLHQAIDFAFRFDSDVLVEKGLEKPREVFCALLGEGESIRSSECGELKTLDAEFFDYQAKYITVGGCETRVPAEIPAQTRAAIRQGSEQVFRAMRGSGLARVDFLIDQEGKAWFSEINTLPGMSETSLYPQLFEAVGIAYKDLLEELISIALNLYQRKQGLTVERMP
ncbi:MAG: D-alanine--D-alanine ligase [Elusimicrobiaceae bacterium]|nr:D-alanine--D-alanine ligase [Elusimicrobiaceae bacterium]